MRCDRCQEMVVEGVYCTRCGVRQGIPEELASRVAWRGSYAAHPGEHVLQPSFFSTLFPQLDPAQRCEFCWTLLAGLATIALLWIFGLIAAAILVAVGLLPVLYLLYLYAEQIDWRGWVLVMGLAVGAGVLLGIVTSFAASLLRPPLGIGVGDVWGDVNSIDWLVLLGFGISIPIIQEVVKPLPLLLLRRGNFSGVASGLTLGVAVGIGFSAALTVINFSALLVGQDLRAMAGNWIFPLLTIALLQPVMQGACTGLVAVAIWRKGDRIAVLGAVAGHLAFSLGSSLIGRFNLIGMLAWQMAVVLLLLVLVRYRLHSALLEEGRAEPLRDTTCPHCQKYILAAGFCPSCGLALSVVPIARRSSWSGLTNESPATAAFTASPDPEEA